MTTVKPGQTWQDADPRIETERHQRRMIRVVAVNDPEPGVAQVVSWYEQLDTGKKVTAERPSTIRLARFRPTSTGYRLVRDEGD